jgi:hypothetical protein
MAKGREYADAWRRMREARKVPEREEPRPLDPDYLNPEQARAAQQIESEWQAKQQQKESEGGRYVTVPGEPMGSGGRPRRYKTDAPTTIGKKYAPSAEDISAYAAGMEQARQKAAEMTTSELASHPAGAEHMARALQATTPQMKAHHTREAREAVEKAIQTGARGGRYYISPTGQKVYVKDNPGTEVVGYVPPAPFVGGLPQSVTMAEPRVDDPRNMSMMFGNRPK